MNKGKLKVEKFYKIVEIAEVFGTLVGLLSSATMIGVVFAKDASDDKMDSLKESIYQSEEYNDYVTEKLNYNNYLYENGEISKEEFIEKNKEIEIIDNYINETKNEDHIEAFNKLESKRKIINIAEKVSVIGLLTAFTLLLSSDFLERKANKLFLSAKIEEKKAIMDEIEGDK